MFTESAELYDLIYANIKDYRAECAKLVELIAGTTSPGRSVLDVACGTGEHLKILSEDYGLEVDGLDLDEGLLAVARRKNPERTFFRADMTSFALGRTYDVVMCLFSSIGYAQTLDRVKAALACFADHLKPGGIVIVEPWFAPDQWLAGNVLIKTGESDGVKVVRMSHTAARGTTSIWTLEYLIGTSAGIERRREVHEIGMFTQAEMFSCFAAAGLTAEYDPAGLSARGLYVARR